MPPSPLQIPRQSPSSQIPVSPSPANNQQTGGSQNLAHGPGQSHSLFLLGTLPPLSPSLCRDSPSTPASDQVVGHVLMEERNGSSHSLLPPSFGRGGSTRVPESLPPRKTHRRSHSDTLFGFSTTLQSLPPILLRGSNSLDKSKANGGESNAEGQLVGNLFSAYMNLDDLDRLNSSGAENCEDLDWSASGAKANGGDSSDNEATSINENGNHMQRSAILSISDKRKGINSSAGGDIASTTRHHASMSMDVIMEKMNFADGGCIGRLSQDNLLDANSNTFRLEFGKGEFSGAELKKIMANEKLAEIALTDPKRAKRILANRQSAARSKERKMHYIMELEQKVRFLHNEARTMSAQLTELQRDSAGLTSQNNELKFRLQAMEQEALLRNALNEALTAEVQHLKIMAAEPSGAAAKFLQLSTDTQMFQSRHQQQEPQDDSATTTRG